LTGKSPGTREAAPSQVAGLRRDLGLLDATGIGLGAIIGAGIFVVTGVAAGVAGPAFLVGLFIAGVVASANALSSAQLAARFPRSGGTYEYGYQVLHPWAGFAAGWMFLSSKIAAAGTVAIGLSGYLDALFPGIPPRGIAVGAIVVFTLLNYFGVRRSSRANLVIVSVSLTTLLFFIASGVPSFDASRLAPFAPAGWRGTLEAAAILFFAYTGYARIATLGEEVRNPKTTIPKAIIATIGLSIVLYAGVALVAVGAVGAPAMAASAAPLAVAADASPLPGAVVVISLGGVTAMLGVILSQLLGLSRMVFAMARRGDLPPFLERIDARSGAPGRAVLLVGAVAAVVAGTGTLVGVATAAAFTILVYYGIANVAALKMPREAKLYPDVVPLFGAASCALLALSLDPGTIGAGALLLATGFVLRIVVRRTVVRPGTGGTG
jgi:basic amino acid/polyamine antiporter, APA family